MESLEQSTPLGLSYPELVGVQKSSLKKLPCLFLVCFLSFQQF